MEETFCCVEQQANPGYTWCWRRVEARETVFPGLEHAAAHVLLAKSFPVVCKACAEKAAELLSRERPV